MRCDSVISAARKYAVHDGPSTRLYLGADMNKDFEFVGEEPSITARPYNETREEFLTRAGRYYDELAKGHIREGATKGAIKRQGGDHFKYLALHLVGRHSFKQISEEAVGLDVEAKSEKTIAGEARNVADLIGLELRNMPGPRPGSRPHRAAHRTRR